MALAARLALRQGQAMVLTPQLLQAIKLLQMPSAELAAFVRDEIERNPLLEMVEPAPEEPQYGAPVEDEPAASDPQPGDWAANELATEPAALAAALGTEVDNAFGAEPPPAPGEPAPVAEGASLSASAWTGIPTGSGGGEPRDLETYAEAALSLAEHLKRQAMVLLAGPRERMIAVALVDELDESGYLAAPLQEIASRIGAPFAEVERVHALLLTLEPTGVFARSLGECLALQLLERDRYDPAMRALVENLPALARRDYAALRRLCGVEDEDLADMIAELKRLEPKPGRAFGATHEPPPIPDVVVTAAPDRTWRVELNSEALPRVLVNETYAATIKRGATREQDKLFVTTQLQAANWLAKSVEQRARTILSVATEIVRRQDAFLVEGVSGLKPLNLKSVADAIGVHESTVSRATANKYMLTPRGLFEMKYFFTTSIASSARGEAHSAESVRHRIKQMIEAEDPRDVLSDDVIVERLREAQIVVARRTVAKYRDSMRIPSSVERRRAKLAPALLRADRIDLLAAREVGEGDAARPNG